ncbi:LPS assembly lipoprotein LptE [Falsiroseomonas sp. CW058]|uniref:LPS assembly lipoprotein LptE n=1 Tax=Falsiroseomonas sp. CW058 TaxID=3388664 RepID=UPI003D322132
MARDHAALSGRRAWLRGAAGMVALGAGGCGFRPLHGEGGVAGAESPAVAQELAATRVSLIPERFGQLLRRGLQQRLGTGVGGPQVARWELRVGPSIQTEGLGVQRDGAVSRVRYVATANWWLVRLSTPPETVANGFERAIEAFNVPPNQFFASDSSRDAAERRLAEMLAEEVATRVAIRFRTGVTGGTSSLIPPVEVPAALPERLVPGGPGLLEPGAGTIGGGLGGGVGLR